MARPKAHFMREIAELADADLKRVDAEGLATKLKAISAAATEPLATVARVMNVTAQTVLRWVGECREGGPDALRPRPSKLCAAQKAAAGEEVHWTLGRLRAAIEEEFGVALGVNTIWVCLRKEGWRQLVPRPRHHQSDAAAQEGFKKKPRR